MHVHPQGGEKNLGAKFTAESCKCIPRQSKGPFLGNWGDLHGGSGYLGNFILCFEGDD